MFHGKRAFDLVGAAAGRLLFAPVMVARARWSVAPGLTGLAQLAGRSRREALVLDRCYLRRRSLLLDGRIVAMSFVVNLLGKSRARRFGR